VLPFVVYLGTSAADTGIGGVNNDTLAGALGDDTLFGLDGDDNLAGGEGNDILVGGAGKDIVVGDAGNDTVLAGAGDDTVLAGAGDDTVFGDEGDDMIFGQQGRDVMSGGAGNDTFFASANDGDDAMDGGAAIDTIDYQAISAALTIDLGTNGTGTVQSTQSGHDTFSSIENVKGGAGNDTIIASNAVNVLSGGGGADTFVFNSAAAANGDTIEDLAPGDMIDLRPFIPNLQDDDVLTSAATFDAAGQVRLTVHGTDTVVEGNTDNDADAEFTLRITGRTNLTGSDFA
jgi:Ca2+-binding RTX toxin-like protein